MDERIYTERKMLVGVAIGGPLAGGYYFWRTLNVLGKPRFAVGAAVAAIGIFAIAIGSGFIPVLDRLPNFVFYAIQFGLVYAVTRGYILTEISEHIAEGKAVYGWGNTILVAVISMVVTLGPLIAVIYYTGPGLFDRTTTRSFGRLKNEIVFDSGNISEPDVERIAAALTSGGFFNEGKQNSVDAARSDDRIIITIYCNETAREPEAIEYFKTLRSDVQRSFPANPIVIDMVIGTPENRIARLE